MRLHPRRLPIPSAIHETVLSGELAVHISMSRFATACGPGPIASLLAFVVLSIALVVLVGCVVLLGRSIS